MKAMAAAAGPRYPTAPTHLRGPEADGAGRQPAGSRADPAPARRSGVHGSDLNLHWFPETIRERFGDGSVLGVDLTYSFEEELLGTAGGVRNVRDYFGSEPFVVMAGDALTDVDMRALAELHQAHDGLATLAVKRVADTSEYGVIVTGAEGRIQGFQEKLRSRRGASRPRQPHDLRAEPGGLRLLPRPARGGLRPGRLPSPPRARRAVRARDRRVLERRRLAALEYLQGNLDVALAFVGVEHGGELVEDDADPDAPGESPLGVERAGLPADCEVDGRVLVGADVAVGAGVRIDGPL